MGSSGAVTPETSMITPRAVELPNGKGVIMRLASQTNMKLHQVKFEQFGLRLTSAEQQNRVSVALLVCRANTCNRPLLRRIWRNRLTLVDDDAGWKATRT
mmetsp:Transcript_46148/g.68762  ORF Transcript_46148/g.68762 Transcript_46148/m.68762 type:complete len:100 (-) Transcript_46148:50-349(-)